MKTFGIRKDGWDVEDLRTTGLIELLEKVELLKHEIENLQRGSYAVRGQNLEDLIVELDELSQGFKDASISIESEIGV